MMEILGIAAFEKSVDDHIAKVKKQAETARKMAVRALVTAMLANIPVWSGRTVRSLRVNNDGRLAPVEPMPPEEVWHTFGRTRLMRLGTEPMRASAMGVAMTELDGADYSFDKSVFVTFNSTAWKLVEQAQAPDGRGRNTAVVSALAIAQMKSKFPMIG